MIKTNDSQFDKVCTAVYDYLQLQGDIFVEVDLVDSQTMQNLNLQTRGQDKPTDVLSFGIAQPTLDTKIFDIVNFRYEYSTMHNAVLLGNIVICDQIAREQAQEYGQTQAQEMTFLFMHGLLHLLGFDHIEQDDRDIMRQKEKAIVALYSNLS